MQDNWQSIGDIAQRMAMAVDRVDEEAEAHCLVEHATDRQRAVIWRKLWDQGTSSWREWATAFMWSKLASENELKRVDELIRDASK